jgi:hypothetical protein
MRVALLASTFALLAGTPAFAQCVYVACQGAKGPAPTYQAPPTAVIVPHNDARADYDAGYAAGLAARTTTHVRRTTSVRTVSRTPHRAAPVAKRHKARVAPRTQTTHRIVRQVNRPARHAATRHATRTPTRHVARTTHSTTYTSYRDPIKDRASTYRATSYGSVTSMASLMTATTTWVGPTNVSTQNGQTCGWGARIVTNPQGHAQRQAMWVCQCPQGWRPPGY